jgi:hypothetical protein
MKSAVLWYEILCTLMVYCCFEGWQYLYPYGPRVFHLKLFTLCFLSRLYLQT